MLNTSKPKQLYIFILSIFSCILFYTIVFYTGGTIFPFPHLFYFAIIFASFFGNWCTALFTAVFSSVLMSYWFMPLNIAQNIRQDHFDWLFRTAMFVFVAVIVKISADSIRNKKKQYVKTSKQIINFQQATFNGILNLAEARDPETTGKHLERLSRYASTLLENMKISPAEKQNIISTIAFHDIGKIAIPDHILQKPEKLTASEFEIIKQHTVIGGSILHEIEKSLTFEEHLYQMIKTARELAYFHHERPDGTGYPLGLKGSQIPFAAKVTAICDVYDALSSKRPYKNPIPHEKCIEIIKAGRGTQFDEEVVDQFLTIHHKFKYIAKTFKDEKILFQNSIIQNYNKTI